MPKHGRKDIKESVLPMEVNNLLLRRKCIILDFLEVQKKLNGYSKSLGLTDEESGTDITIEQILNPDAMLNKSSKALEAAESERIKKNSASSLREKLDSINVTALL